MKRYTLNENKGDIAYEVEDNLLTLKVRPEFVSSIPVGEGVYIIKTGDNTIPSDYNVLSAKRTMEEIEGAITGIKPAEQYWAIVKNSEDGTELEESEWFLAPKAGYSIYSPKNITAAGAIVAGYTSPNIEDPGVPIAGYEAIGYSKYDPEHFVVDETGLVRIKDGAGGGTGEFKDITLITSTSTEQSSDYSVYTSLKVDNLLKNIDGKPSSLWVKDKKSEYLLLSDDGTKARLLLPFDITGTLDVSGRIATQSDVAAEGAVWAGLKSTTVASNPVAGYDAIGMCRFDPTQFTVNQGLVRITGNIGGGTTSYWGDSGTGWAYAVLNEVSKQVSLHGHVHDWGNIKVGKATSADYATKAGEAATADKLTTSCTIWGQSFNGTADIIGDLSTTSFSTDYAGNIILNKDGGIKLYQRTVTFGTLKYVGTPYIDFFYSSTSSFNKDNYVRLISTSATQLELQGSGNANFKVKTNLSVGVNISAGSNITAGNNISATGSVTAGLKSTATSTNNLPIAGTSAKGICYFDSTQFSVTNGKVSILSSVISGGEGGSTVSWGTTANKVSPLNVNGTSKDVCLSGYVSFSRTVTTGTKIGTLTINDKTKSTVDIYAPTVGTTGDYYKPRWDGYVLYFDRYNSSNVIQSSATSGINLRGAPGASISSVTEKSTSSDPGGYSEYNCVGSDNQIKGTFKVYNGTQGPAGNLTLGSSVTSRINIICSTTVSYSAERGASNWATERWSHRNSFNGTYAWYNTNFNSMKSACAEIGTDGSWNKLSDERTKNTIGNITNVLDDIEKINVIRYTLKNSSISDVKIGIGALSVKSVFPEVVNKGEYNKDYGDCLYSLDYSTLGAVVSIAGLKELHSLVKIQREEINSLRSWRLDKEEQISSLESRIAKLEQMLNELTVK